MTQAQKDHTHTGDPWLVLGPRALIAINRALERVGDGSREADNG